MNPLILTAITVIGIIGIIGTVEYAQAQTVLTIPEPDDMPEPQERGISIAANPERRDYWYIRPNNTIATSPIIDSIGNIRIPSPDRLPLLKNPFLPEKYDTPTQLCSALLHNVGSILNGNYLDRNNMKHNVTNLKIPSNIKEQTNDTIIAIGFNFSPSIESDKEKCTIGDFEAPSKHPILTSKELRYTLYNQSDNKAYHFSPRESIFDAQPIPLCTNSTIDTTTQTLKGNTKMCYGKNGNDMVIITKQLTGFYGATEQFVITEYMKLQQRLYLPAI